MPTPNIGTTTPVRLRRNRPLNLSIGRIILTGLLYPTSEHLYLGAQLLVLQPDTTTPITYELRIGDTFNLNHTTWMLHTVLELHNGESSATIGPNPRSRRQPHPAGI